MIREMDRVMVLRIQPKEGAEKEKSTTLSKITMSSIISCQSTNSAVRQEKGEVTIWRQGHRNIDRIFMQKNFGESNIINGKDRYTGETKK